MSGIRKPDASVANTGNTFKAASEALSADEFAGGFMHRFLLAHENDPDFMVKEIIPTASELASLASDLQTIRNEAPDTLTVDARASSRLDALQRQPRYYGNAKLAGFYNRIDGLVLKLAMNFCLGDGRGTITLDDVECAQQLLLRRFAPPLETVLDQLDAPPEKKMLFDLADSLLSTGPVGWSMLEFKRKLGKANPGRQSEARRTLIDMGLAFMSTDGKKMFGRADWVRQYEGEDDHGFEVG